MFLLNALIISIHAPTRGATFYYTTCTYNVKFQSTLLQEERRFIQNVFFGDLIFQSTLLQEERRRTSSKYGRSDFISIHAPTRGATSEYQDINL